MKRFRPIIVSLLSLALMLAIAGCAVGKTDNSGPASSTPASSDTSSDVKVLIVGCDDYPPFTYNDDSGNMVGIDVEIITEACRRIGYQAQCQFIDWNSKATLLANGEIDCIASSFSISGRENDYRWAGPYMKSRQVIAVSPGSDITSLADLEGKVIAVRSTTKSESVLLDNLNEAVPEVESILSFADRAYLIPSLLKGYVDAVASHETSLLQYEKDYSVDLRILDEPLVETGIGFAFGVDDYRGIDKKLTIALNEMRADDTMERILSKYVDNPELYLDLSDIDSLAGTDE